MYLKPNSKVIIKVVPVIVVQTDSPPQNSEIFTIRVQGGS